MNKLSVGIFVSGEGSTFKAVNDCIRFNFLQLNVAFLLINRKKEETNQELVSYCENNGINVIYNNYDKETCRHKYQEQLLELLSTYNVDFNLLLGWNLILNEQFITRSAPIYNLHPALPNTFVGNNCVSQAFNSFTRGEIEFTGSMIHRVTPEVDKGQVQDTIKVKIYNDDTLEKLEERVKSYEKGLVISFLHNMIKQYNLELTQMTNNDVYVGKVRNVEDIGYGYLLLTASDRLSSFDRYICDIENKGSVLNNMSKWWFNETKHIVDNHFLYSSGQHMVVRKAKPIKLEFVMRGYMTGSTNTSIWPMYKNGNRNMYGIKFRDGYQKNEKLDRNIITPTTKGVSDHPITREGILSEGYLTEEQYNFIQDKCFKLFNHGQKVADSKDLILVDTKYEFGFVGNDIVLIDELHTCDSSRYWKKSSYQDRLNNGQEPEKMDKDCIRDFIKKNCDPYKDKLPLVPEELKERVRNVYRSYYTVFDTNNTNLDNVSRSEFLDDFFNNNTDRMVVIIAGSESDHKHCNKIKDKLKEKNIYSVIHYCSAHKNTRGVLKILDSYESRTNTNICYVTVAGMSNALSGVVSCNTKFPVVACPPFSDKVDMMTNINSSLQCPSNVPVMTILSPLNVAVAINKIFNLPL